MTFGSDVLIDNKYRIIKEIGSGGTGIVYLAYHHTLQKYVVLKKIKQGVMDRDMMRKEADLLKNLHHTYLPTVYDCINVGNDFYTVIDYINGYSLEDFLASGGILDKSTAVRWMTQLAEVLVYLHSRQPKIIHSDIKPANIIITNENNVCLIDFNISLDDGDDILGYSEYYASPEQVMRAMSFMIRQQGLESISTPYGLIHSDSYMNIPVNEKTDIYSLGATFYHLVSGVCPKNDAYNPLLSQIMPQEDVLYEIIDRCMMLSMNERYESAEALLKALKGMYKLSASYKRLNLLRWLSAVTGAAVLSAGVIMWVYGTSLKDSERFHAQYKSVIESLNDEDYKAVIESGKEFIDSSENKKALAEEPKLKAEVLHSIAVSYFAHEDYEQAAFYDNQAINEYDDNEYYDQYIIALIRCGKDKKAQDVIKRFPGTVDSYRLAAYKMELCYKQGDYSQVLSIYSENADKGFSSDADALSLCGGAYSKLSMPEKALPFFKSAYEKDDSIYNLRRLGEVYIDLANESIKKGDTAASKEYSLNSYKCFKKISSGDLSLSIDHLNLLQCCSHLSYNDEAKNVIERAIELYPNDYRVYAEAAKYYSEQKQSGVAAEYALKARALLPSMIKTDEQMYYDGLISALAGGASNERE